MTAGPENAAPEDITAEDAALLAELAAALRERTTPPPDVVAAAKQLFTWRTVDAELARLTYDSLLDDNRSGVRSGEQPRILTFEAGAIVVELEVDESPGRRRVLGQLDPAGPVGLELRSAAAPPVTGRADELGRFVLPLPAERGPTSLRCTTDDGRVVETSWSVL